MRNLLLIIFLFVSVSGNCQTKQGAVKTATPQNKTVVQPKTEKTDYWEPKYAVYPTENLKIFIKLNTATGEMWLFQYTTDTRSNAFQVSLSTEDLSPDKGKKNGRFKLQPTKNMFNFILLDQIDGGIWQVQWNVDAEKRMVFRID